MSYDAWKTTEPPDFDADREAAELETALQHERAESALTEALQVLGVDRVRDLIEQYVAAPLAATDGALEIEDWDVPF